MGSSLVIYIAQCFENFQESGWLAFSDWWSIEMNRLPAARFCIQKSFSLLLAFSRSDSSLMSRWLTMVLGHNTMAEKNRKPDRVLRMAFVKYSDDVDLYSSYWLQNWRKLEGVRQIVSNHNRNWDFRIFIHVLLCWYIQSQLRGSSIVNCWIKYCKHLSLTGVLLLSFTIHDRGRR